MRLSFFFEIEGNVTECLFLIVLLPESALNRNMAQPDLKPHNTMCLLMQYLNIGVPNPKAFT